MVGGGGGGGGAAAASVGNNSAAGGGGGGGYAELLITSPSSTYSYTVGGGGAGGTAGNNAGTGGSTTTFGASLQATGGAGGGGSAAFATTGSQAVAGGAGGVGSNGSINGGGGPGGASFKFGTGTLFSGAGGTSIFGEGGLSLADASGAGNAGAGSGGGGGGAADTNSDNTAQAGGNGSSGIIIVEEYYLPAPSTAPSVWTNPGGRLTLTSNTPVTTTDVTGATSIYYTPYINGFISLWNGSVWQTVSFTQVTLALGTITSGLPYDVFGYLNGGSLALDAPLAWTNGTTRATAVTIQNGAYCKSGDATRLYLGTFYTTSTTTTADAAATRFLWNMYNREPRPLIRAVTATTWSGVANSTYRYWDGDSANKVEFICGLDSVPVYLAASQSWTGNACIALNLDSATPTDPDGIPVYGQSSGYTAGTSVWDNFPGLGYHYLALCEAAFATTTFTGHDKSGSTYYAHPGARGNIAA